MAKISFLIPARNEEFLVKTIDDILEHTGDESEIIVGLDGYWPPQPIKDNPRVKIFHVTEPIGQRAMQNQLARLSRSKYVAKIDAHCSLDKDFGIKMLKFFEEVGDHVVAVPVMRNLCAFDWVCPEAKPRINFDAQNEPHRRYQSPSGPCKDCGKETVKELTWKPRKHSRSYSYCFDNKPHFQYFGDYEHRPEFKKMAAEKGYTETMSLQGSFFMSTRHNYWKYELCDERAGSWGNQGLEVACAAWLSGLRVLCNHKTWYAHMFRTQGGDFGFPYRIKDKHINKTKDYIKDKYWNMKNKKQIHKVKWLLDKFKPVPNWKEEDLKGLE